MALLAGAHELRMAWRRARRRPGRGLAVALTLTLGVGSLTAAFTAVDQVLLRDLPVRAQEELVVAWFVNPARGFTRIPFRPETYDILEGAGSLAGVAGVESAGARPTPVEGVEGSFAMRHVRVAGDFFGVLGVEPARGRLLQAGDDLPGAAPVLVLSHGAWVARYGADPSVVGSSVRYLGRPFTVVGVAAEGFDWPRGTDMWATLRGAYPRWGEEEPPGIELDLVGRMAGGVSADAVADDLSATLRSDVGTRDTYTGLAPVVTSLEDHVVGALRPVLRLALASAVALVLAALANVTLLLLAGGGRAARDVAVRRALGAEPGRVMGQLVADMLLIAVMGLAGGLVLAWLALEGLLPLAPPELPRLDEVALDGRGVLVALLTALVCAGLGGVTAGWVVGQAAPPAILVSRQSGGSGGGAIRRSVAALQVALAVMAAVGAALLVRTVVTMDRLELGFDPDGLSVVTLSAPYTYFSVPDAYFGALEQVARDLEGRAGIESVLPTLAPPLSRGLQLVLRGEGQSQDDVEENPYMALNAVLPGHTEALGLRLLAGRTLSSSDNTPESDPVVVIDEETARALQGGASALGRRIGGFGDPDTWWTVVGVVARSRYHEYLGPVPTAFYPMRRLAAAPPTQLLVRTSGVGPSSVRGLVLEAFAAVDPGVRVISEEKLADVLRRPASRPRFAAGILLGFAGATLLLAFAGVYGVFTVWVQERAWEMAVRRALGARRRQVLTLVLGGTLRTVAPGVAAGLAASFWATSLVESLLFGVSARDPATLVGVGLMATMAALLAGLAPALRAAATDPAETLRTE